MSLSIAKRDAIPCALLVDLSWQRVAARADRARNLANLTLFSSAIPGPEQYLAGRPLMVVTLVFVQIVATLALVGLLAERGRLVREPARPTGREAAQPHERA